MRRVIVILAAIVAAFVPAHPSVAGDKNKDEREHSCNAEKRSGSSCNRSGNDDCRDANAPCSDDDLSPDIRDSQIYICAVPRSCPREDRGDGADESNPNGDEEDDEYAEPTPAP